MLVEILLICPESDVCPFALNNLTKTRGIGWLDLCSVGSIETRMAYCGYVWLQWRIDPRRRSRSEAAIKSSDIFDLIIQHSFTAALP